MELDRLERDQMDEEWDLAVGDTQERMQDAEGALQDASVDVVEGLDFCAAVLVGVWGKLICRNLTSKQP